MPPSPSPLPRLPLEQPTATMQANGKTSEATVPNQLPFLIGRSCGEETETASFTEYKLYFTIRSIGRNHCRSTARIVLRSLPAASRPDIGAHRRRLHTPGASSLHGFSSVGPLPPFPFL